MPVVSVRKKPLDVQVSITGARKRDNGQFPQTREFNDQQTVNVESRPGGTNPIDTSSSGFTLQIVRDTLLQCEPPSVGQNVGTPSCSLGHRPATARCRRCRGQCSKHQNCHLTLEGPRQNDAERKAKRGLTAAAPCSRDTLLPGLCPVLSKRSVSPSHSVCRLSVSIETTRADASTKADHLAVSPFKAQLTISFLTLKEKLGHEGFFLCLQPFKSPAEATPSF